MAPSLVAPRYDVVSRQQWGTCKMGNVLRSEAKVASVCRVQAPGAASQHPGDMHPNLAALPNWHSHAWKSQSTVESPHVSLGATMGALDHLGSIYMPWVPKDRHLPESCVRVSTVLEVYTSHTVWSLNRSQPPCCMLTPNHNICSILTEAPAGGTKWDTVCQSLQHHTFWRRVKVTLTMHNPSWSTDF